ncbi:EpsD family peptidyl-prolyl cis-trans isomerase [Nitrosomonas sp.]|uniref:EpsD family peptidyl-prolyl cis-trans isomerase n=1 Tax=Nitrosomonas sp. TaxID=42353 RepID=UPI001DDF88F5|nr:EpsD family peptidyl-prolyl cis-trans isomerase [Nitrosomonas sp.]MCB1947502.1 EpsD family peptidyl-prolyl cis-trans isomerase [Nitrosomonas sp.]
MDQLAINNNSMNKKFFSNFRIAVPNTPLLVFTLILFACDSQPTNNEPGQALVRVDGEEITIVQLNDELNRAKVQADQIDQAKKQLLDSMINRQLMVAEAKRNQLDRAPNVMRAIERAKAQIIAQSYMQTTLNQVNEPTDTEISQFYQEHPELFTERKKYHLTFLRFPTKDLDDTLNNSIKSAKTISDAAKLLDKHQILYLRDKMIRTSMDIPSQMYARLQETKKGEMFLVNENTNNLMIFVENIENAPVSIEEVKSQISLHLLNQKRREAMRAAITQLRADANIEYLHAPVDAEAQAITETNKAVQSLTRPLVVEDDNPLLNDTLLQNESIERGISGLK